MEALNKWKKFMIEEQSSALQIYCDMDGVLVDFETGVIDYVNNSLQDDEEGHKYKRKLKGALDQLEREHSITLIDIGFDKSTRLNAARNYMYKLVGDNREFWADLHWTTDGQQLWNHIKQFDPIILTAPMHGKNKGSELGKHDWIEKNLEIDKSKIIMTSDKYKHAAPNHLLIDDMMKYLGPWLEAGGQGIHHKSANKTINKLEELAR